MGKHQYNNCKLRSYNYIFNNENTEPTSPEQKKAVIEYLDIIVFKSYWGGAGATISNKIKLTQARNNIVQSYENSVGGKDYSLDINETDSKGRLEKIWVQILNEVIYYLGNIKEFKKKRKWWNCKR